MDAIYSLMGVCPQHDLLWETLTGREHLMFYGRLKGLTGEGCAVGISTECKALHGRWHCAAAMQFGVLLCSDDNFGNRRYVCK